MAYQLKRSDKSIDAAMRRIIGEQVEAALTDLTGDNPDRPELVHSARKHCKQLRALIRLVRPGLSNYAEANARLRALALPLAPLRDADVMIETCDTLARDCSELDRAAAATVRRGLVRNRKALAAIVDPAARLSGFAEDVAALRDEAANWHVDPASFDVVTQGAVRTYRRARKAMKHAAVGGNADAFHEWRKSVKYHWYHTRLLAPIWPDEMAVHVEAARDLGELLGHHHDLAVLDHVLAAHAGEFGGEEAVMAVRAALATRSEATAKRALREGRLLLSESPDALGERWGRYWSIWRGERAPVDRPRAA